MGVFLSIAALDATDEETTSDPVLESHARHLGSGTQVARLRAVLFGNFGADAFPRLAHLLQCGDRLVPAPDVGALRVEVDALAAALPGICIEDMASACSIMDRLDFDAPSLELLAEEHRLWAEARAGRLTFDRIGPREVAAIRELSPGARTAADLFVPLLERARWVIDDAARRGRGVVLHP